MKNTFENKNHFNQNMQHLEQLFKFNQNIIINILDYWLFK